MKLFYFLILISYLFSITPKNKGLQKKYQQDIKDTLTFKKTMNKALAFYRQEKLDSFKKYTQYAFKRTQKPQEIQEIHNYLATFYDRKSILDSAYYHYNISKNILLKLGDTITAGKRMYYLGFIQLNEHDLLASEISHIKALKIFEKANRNTFKHNIYNNLGIIAEEKGNAKDALKYYNLSLQELAKDTTKNISFKLNIINNKGLLYQKLKQYQKAISYFEKGLAFDSIKEKYPSKYALLLENLAVTNYYLGTKKSVLKQYEEVLKIKEKLQVFSSASVTCINIHYSYKDLKQYDKARFYLKKGLKYAKKTNNNKYYLKALKNLSKLTKGEKAIDYLKKYIELNDSLQKKERQLKDKFAKIRYETDKRQKENKTLKIENQKKKILIKQHKQKETIGWLFAFIGLLLFIGSLVFFFSRKKRLLYLSQLKSIQARDDERQQIAKELHDQIAGDLRLLHQKLEKSNLIEEAKKLKKIKQNVRNLSHQLNSISFSKVSFKNQIINLVSDYFEPNFIIKITGLQEYNYQNINNSIKIFLYLSTRESIQNSKKHAQATKIKIQFKIDKKQLFLNIIDNGIGFDTNNINKKGIGLQNLQERVEALHGTLSIKSEKEKGTQINIQIPFK